MNVLNSVVMMIIQCLSGFIYQTGIYPEFTQLLFPVPAMRESAGQIGEAMIKTVLIVIVAHFFLVSGGKS